MMSLLAADCSSGASVRLWTAIGKRQPATTTAEEARKRAFLGPTFCSRDAWRRVSGATATVAAVANQSSRVAHKPARAEGESLELPLPLASQPASKLPSQRVSEFAFSILAAPKYKIDRPIDRSSERAGGRAANSRAEPTQLGGSALTIGALLLLSSQLLLTRSPPSEPKSTRGQQRRTS